MTADDEPIAARLLRLGGPRPPVAADRSIRVRDAVHLRWHAETRKRVIRRRLLAAGGALAAAAALILAIGISRARNTTGSPVTATLAVVERTEGTVQRLPAGGRQFTTVTTADALRAGEWIETGPTGRVALRLPDDSSLRMDVASRVHLLTSTLVELAAGALYVDTGPRATGLQVQTPLGTAHDIGTQFEVRVMPASVRIRVRSGIVELRREKEYASVRAGTELTATSTGLASREVSIFGPEWEWAAALDRPFAIEGRTLTTFLEHLAHEQGWVLRYEDARLAREVSSVTMHGSIDGLPPIDALTVVLNTTGFAHRLRDGELLITRGESAR